MPYNHHYAVIIAGGSGTRLWPVSRQKLPKQFQRLAGKLTLIQHMGALVSRAIPWDHLFVMTVESFRVHVQRQLPKLPSDNLLIEPEQRDNGPAIVLAMSELYKRDPKATVALLWADHLIQDAQVFAETLQAAFAAANQYPEHLITIGANPSNPDNTLGYIRMGEQLPGHKKTPIYKVREFTEKPDISTARRYLASWDYLWNVGYKIMSAQSFLQAIQKIHPQLKSVIQALPKSYTKLPKLSIEYLFTQHWKDILVIPTDMGWSDVGNWSSLHEILSAGKTNTLVTHGPVRAVDSSDSLIYAKDRPIMVLGARKMVVVDTGDVILVMSKDAAPDIKKLVDDITSINPDLL